jgi:hypothetical protein
VVAKSDRAHKGLAEQFAAHGADGRLERRYLALVWGAPDGPRGSIDAALARSRANRTKIAVVSEAAGRPRRHPLRGAGDLSKGERSPLPACSGSTLETGRTHQVRVHLAHIGHPLLGDYDVRRGLQGERAQALGEERAAALGRSAARRCTRPSSPSCTPLRARLPHFESRCRPTWPRLAACAGETLSGDSAVRASLALPFRQENSVSRGYWHRRGNFDGQALSLPRAPRCSHGAGWPAACVRDSSALDLFVWLGLMLVGIAPGAVAKHRPRSTRRAQAGAPRLGRPHRVSRRQADGS